MEGSTTTSVLCGAYDGMTTTPCGTFNPGSPCSSVSGLSAMVVLSPSDPRQIFCVPIGGSFRILNTGGNIKLRITCQHDQIDPDSHDFSMNYLDEAFFVSDGECFLLGCP